MYLRSNRTNFCSNYSNTYGTDVNDYHQLKTVLKVNIDCVIAKNNRYLDQITSKYVSID